MFINIYDIKDNCAKTKGTEAPPSAAPQWGDAEYFQNMFHIISLVCFLLQAVKSRSRHERMTDCGSISHIWAQS